MICAKPVTSRSCGANTRLSVRAGTVSHHAPSGPGTKELVAGGVRSAPDLHRTLGLAQSDGQANVGPPQTRRLHFPRLPLVAAALGTSWSGAAAVAAAVALLLSPGVATGDVRAEPSEAASAAAMAMSYVPSDSGSGSSSSSSSSSSTGSSSTGTADGDVPVAPPCPDGLCPGEVGGTLNTCSLYAASCVSVMADDQEHFVAPWSFEAGDLLGPRRPRGSGGEVADGNVRESALERDARQAAIDRLLYIAMGGYYEPGLSTDPYVTNGYSRIDAANYLIQGAFSSVTGGPQPSRPQPLRDARSFRPFDGVLEDRHDTQDGGIYLRIRFGNGEDDADGAAAAGRGPLVAEFLFPKGDDIVTLRCAEAPKLAEEAESDEGSVGRGGRGRLALSFERGLEWDTNTARRRMEMLRKALRWEVVPVVTEFDPKFNNDKPLWFERLYEPFRIGAS